SSRFSTQMAGTLLRSRQRRKITSVCLFIQLLTTFHFPQSSASPTACCKTSNLENTKPVLQSTDNHGKSKQPFEYTKLLTTTTF
uniref:Uncharacterized protein n=1 Tax=Athene cunicularia TaxID=194338 RepID=A0A663M760_ATHCN